MQPPIPPPDRSMSFASCSAASTSILAFSKFFPDLSPAELLASQTIMRLSAGLLDAETALFCLAIMECLLGLALIFNVCMRFAFVLFPVPYAGNIFAAICFARTDVQDRAAGTHDGRAIYPQEHRLCCCRLGRLWAQSFSPRSVNPTEEPESPVQS